MSKEQGPEEKIAVSVVVPVKDEERTLVELYEGIAAALSKENQSFEVIFVDDGSSDQSLAVMKSLRERDRRVRWVHFPRNFGKSAALAAGFDRARGKIIITLDADLQDDPAEIPRFLAALSAGAHLVSGWKKERHDPWSRRLASRLANVVTGVLSGLRLHDMNCGFKAYRREVIQNLRLYGDLHRFIPALAFARGYRVTEIVVQHHPRRFGQSKYGFSRVFSFFDLLTVLFLTQYARRPLHLFGGIGVLLAFLGAIALGYLTALWFVPGHAPIGTRPLFMGGVMLLLLGAQLLSLGLVGELITHLAFRPGEQYIVEEESPPEK